MKDELIALAKEAGFVPNYGISPLPMVDYATCGLDPKLERFANLVAAKEREECAKVCDVMHQHHIDTYGKYFEETYASECAAKIRARKP